MTTEEFLDWEDAQEERHEFVDGEILAMVGASLVHATICVNLAAFFKTALRGRGCFTFQEGAKLRAGKHIFYPDLVVSCGRDRLTQRCLERPSLIVEVLSPSTAGYDRITKRARYQEHLPTLQAYLLVAQDELAVEVARRTPEGWHSTTARGLDAVIELAEPPCRFTLADIYEDVADLVGTDAAT